MKRHPEWLMLFSRNLWLMYQDIARLAALSHVHDVKRRLADWLLMSEQRCGQAQLVMTHQHIANMLGVRREGVTEAAGQLQKARLISYKRGRIKVEDRPGLEQRSCECYAVVKKEYDRLLPNKEAV